MANYHGIIHADKIDQPCISHLSVSMIDLAERPLSADGSLPADGKKARQQVVVVLSGTG